MAIDDNASYELTGYQVKDLAQKIRAKADSASLASVATSGLYSDLTGAPTIPTVYNGTLTIQQNGTALGTFSANQSTDTTINLTGGGATYTAGNGISIDANNEISIDDTVVAELVDIPGAMIGATSSTPGVGGIVPAPAAGDQDKVLKGDGTWGDAEASLVEMSYGESNAWAKFIAAYNAGSIVYCRASSNSNPATGSQTRKAFMAYVNNATSPTNVEFQYVRSMSSKTDSQQCDQVFVYTLTNTSGGTWSVASRNMGPKIVAGTGMTSTFTTGANATITLNASAMTGATSGAAGTAGTVPAPAAGDQDKVLTGDGTWKALTNVLYPIGSIYMSATLATAADVEAALGGTWVAWGSGRVPIGVDTGDTDFDTVEETGGSKTHTHGLNDGYAKLNIRGNGQIPYKEKSVASWTSNYKANADSGGGDSQSSSYGIELGGSTDSGSTMPPYITCYMYKRTA